jgi:hypothetical protein
MYETPKACDISNQTLSTALGLLITKSMNGYLLGLQGDLVNKALTAINGPRPPPPKYVKARSNPSRAI